ncbi:MAG: purine-nucleoside phosphorylase [Desulfurococcaceae archaeon]
MEPVHIRARKGEVAERVVVAGDPARVKLLAEFLESPRLVNDVRGYYVYTGLYRGVPITVAVHGVGSASAALVVEELHMLGARAIVRLGTCGAMVEGLDVGDVVVASGASYYCGGIFQQYVGEPVCQAAVPDYELLEKIVGGLRAIGKRHVVAPVISCDAFYTEQGFVEKWARRGAVAVDMETATILSLGLLKGFGAASVMIVSNSLVKPTGFALAKELEGHVREVAPAILDSLASTRIQA